MREYSYCELHLNKMIFLTKEDAKVYMRLRYPWRKYQTYPCPEVEGHFHVRDTVKRNRHRYEKRQARRLR
jgi:hypothetical protein